MLEVSIISTLLRQLLRTHNRVSLPGLGAFMVDLTSAGFIKGGKAMLPPSRRITFSSSETWNDGLLEQALAKDQGYTPEGAQTQVTAFSQKLHEQLTAGRRIEFPELGVLRMTADGEWRFMPLETADVDNDAFGLLELEMTPLNPEPPAPLHPVTRPPAAPSPYTPSRPPAPAAEPPVENRCNVACWILIVLVLVVVSGYLFRRPILNFIEKSYYTSEELNYLYGRTTNTEKPATTPPPAPAPVATPEVKVEPEPVRQEAAPRPVYKEEKTQRSNVFHIFIAQFDNEEEAKTYAKHVKDNDGFSAMVIYAGDNVYKVSVLRYTSQQEAEEILIVLRSTDSAEFRNAWMEKY
jgi:nucleoid DNA-binding protein